MTGKYSIIVENRHLRYELEVKRKYTIIRGDSGRGKSELCFAILNDTALIQCDLTVKVATSLEQLEGANNIVIMDEDFFNRFGVGECVRVMQANDNYYIMITRRKMSELPISVNEIYTLDMDSYRRLDKLVTKNVLSNKYRDNKEESFVPDLIVTEDTNAGFDFFNKLFHKKCACISAGGKSEIVGKLLGVCKNYKTICVVVDGAAFGDCVEDIMTLLHSLNSVDMYILVPESFEFLLLNIPDLGVDTDILNKTYNFCDTTYLGQVFHMNFSSKCTESWEKFYNTYLRNYTRDDSDRRYNKGDKIKTFYLYHYKDILKQLPELNWRG